MDIAIVGITDGAKPPLLAIGEAQWNDTMGIGTIERLQHIRALIARAGRYDTTGTRLVCFSGAGFNEKAENAARADSAIQLIGQERLYGMP